MDHTSALGLVGKILYTVDFGCKLITIFKSLHMEFPAILLDWRSSPNIYIDELRIFVSQNLRLYKVLISASNEDRFFWYPVGADNIILTAGF
jgi:hypothetical protein